MRPEFTIRDAVSEDFEFYKNLHHELFEELVTPIWGWEPQRQLEIVKRQFGSDKIQIIQVGKTNMGVVQIEEKPDEFFLSQLWIASDYQNQGIGTKIVKETIKKAVAKKCPLRLHVLKTNRARKFYERLGFIVDGTDEGGFFMRKDP